MANRIDFITWLGVYRAHAPAIRGGDNSTLRLDLDNDPQPDAYLRVLAEIRRTSAIGRRIRDRRAGTSGRSRRQQRPAMICTTS
jgi:hypothetical protein